MMRAEMGKEPSRAPPSQLNLPPGFRFYPSDEELVVHYLCKKAACEPFAVPIIAEVELYKYDPWDLPERALFGEKEWYFFSPRDRKYPNGSRPNRAAGSGYWKATGTDKPINTGGNKKVGVKKALVFYKGKAPKGVKTNWIMHEYRLADSAARSAKRKGSLRLDDWVLCRIYKKCSSAQKAAAAAAAAADEAEAATHNSKDRSDQEDSSIDDDTLESLPEITAPTDNSMGIINATPNNTNFTFMQNYMPSYSNPMDVGKYGMMDAQFSSLPQTITPLKYATHATPSVNTTSTYATPSVNTTSSEEFSRRDSPPESSSIEESHGPLHSHPHLNLGALDNNSLLGGLPSPSALLPPGAFSNDLDFLYNTSDYLFNTQSQQRLFSSYLDNRISHF